MSNSPLGPDIHVAVSELLSLFIAYTRTRSAEQRKILEDEILARFDGLGATQDQSIIRVRETFEALRADTVAETKATPAVVTRAREFTTKQIRDFERLPSNPRLTQPAREILRIPLSEATSILDDFNADQAHESLNLILNSLKNPPTSKIEGDGEARTSIAVIRAINKHFCSIPPFCTGRK